MKFKTYTSGLQALQLSCFLPLSFLKKVFLFKDTRVSAILSGLFIARQFRTKLSALTHLLIKLATMWTLNIIPILLGLKTAAATPFVTNVLTGIPYQGISADGVEELQNISYARDTSGANHFAPPVLYLLTRGYTSNGNWCCVSLGVGTNFS